MRLYAGVQNRRKAVEVLENGLKKHPKDSKLLKVRDEMGYRKAPYLQFLPRTHPINKFYSRAAGGMTKNVKIVGMVLFALIAIGLIVGVFLTIVK